MSSDALLLFFCWLAAQGFGVITQWVFSNIKFFEKRAVKGRKPADVAEWFTEVIFVVAFILHGLLYIFQGEFRASINYLWGEYTIGMGAILLIGWLLEFFPPIEKWWNPFGGHGAVWLGLIFLFSLLTA